MTKENVKLLALDLDGTLFQDDLIITKEAKNAIKAAGDKGVVVTLATGRMFRSALPFAQQLGLTAPLICYQGAMVRNPVTNETLFHRPIPLELARQFIGEVQKRHLHVHTYVNDHLYVAAMTEEAQFYSRLAGVEAELVGNLLDFTDRPEREPTKLVITTQPDFALGLVDEFQAIFGEKLYVTRSHARLVEAVNPACSKGVALEALARALDIPQKQVMAVGDNLNDLPMFDYAGVKVAVANAAPGIKEKADYVTQGAVAAGVVEAIERFILR